MKQLMALFLLIVPMAAGAEVQCTQVGNTTYCTDTETGQQTACTRVGNTVYCN